MAKTYDTIKTTEYAGLWVDPCPFLWKTGLTRLYLNRAWNFVDQTILTQAGFCNTVSTIRR